MQRSISRVSALAAIAIALAMALASSAQVAYAAPSTGSLKASSTEVCALGSGKDLYLGVEAGHEGEEYAYCQVAVEGLTSGSATYNKARRELTLNNVHADTVLVGTWRQVAPVTTVKLVGANVLAKTLNASDADGLVITGSGSLTIENSDDGIVVGTYSRYKTHSLTITGGTINIVAPTYSGVSVLSGNLYMKGGKLNVTNAYGTPISAIDNSYRGKTYGGLLSITGGKVKAEIANTSQHDAMVARKMTNKASCLASVKGRLPCGATIKVGKNEYRIGVNDYNGAVVITKYGAKSKSPKFKNVKFGSVSYTVQGVGKKAFNTKAGKKVKAITFKDTLYKVDAYAFKGAKSLASLKIAWLPLDKYKYTKRGYLKSVKWAAYSAISKKAFKQAGKNAGGGLKIVIGNSGVYKKELSVYKKLFTSKGLSKKATFKTYK